MASTLRQAALARWQGMSEAQRRVIASDGGDLLDYQLDLVCRVAAVILERRTGMPVRIDDELQPQHEGHLKEALDAGFSALMPFDTRYNRARELAKEELDILATDLDEVTAENLRHWRRHSLRQLL